MRVHVPVPPDLLARLYPSKDDYWPKFAAATDAAVAAGFVLADDADEMNAIAAGCYPA